MHESAGAFGLPNPIVLIAVPSMQYHSAEFVFLNFKISIFLESYCNIKEDKIY